MRKRDITAVMVAGALAISMVACGKTEEPTVDDTDTKVEEVIEEEAPAPWEVGTDTPATFLTDEERELFDQAIGSEDADTKMTITPVAFLAKQIDEDYAVRKCTFLTQTAIDGKDVSWNVVTANYDELFDGRPTKGIDYIEAGDPRTVDAWEGISAVMGDGWWQHMEPTENLPKAKEEHQKPIDEAVAANFTGENAVFGPIGTQHEEKDGVTNSMYLVENVSGSDVGTTPIWMFATVSEKDDGTVELASLEYMDMMGYVVY